jgi:hypothetical protein
MPDTEKSFPELMERCDRTIEYLRSFDARSLDGSEDREVVIKFPNGMGYRFLGGQYLAGLRSPISSSRHDRLRDPPQCRRVARKAGLPSAPRATNPGE